jgi:hypothetical protein
MEGGGGGRSFFKVAIAEATMLLADFNAYNNKQIEDN